MSDGAQINAGADPRPKPFGVLAVLGIMLGVVLSIVKALIWSGGTVNAEVLGYALAGIAIPGVIAFAVAGLGKLRNPNRFALTFCALSLVFLLLEVSNHPENLKDHVSRLMREAAGTKPVQGRSTETDRLTRNMLSEILDLRKSHDAKTAKFKDDLGQLYSVDSFSTVTKMQRCVEAVRATLSADQEFSRQFQVWKDRTKEEVEHSSLSDSDKRHFMKGVEQRMGDSKILALRNQVVEAEAKWANATIGLYGLAVANTGKIAVNGSKIVINDDKVRSEFNRELEDSKNLRSNMRSLNSQMAQLQREGMQQIGITPKDIGLPDSNPASH
jgi:hypothetical protein